MDPKLWELIEAGPDEDEVALIIRRVAGEPLPPEVRLVADFGEIATCRMPRGAIRAVREHASVNSLKAPNLLAVEDEPGVDPLDRDGGPGGGGREARCRGSDRRRPPGLGLTGRGVVVGVVDWGCDFAHLDFRHDDGRTRLLALWDQRPGARPGSPEPYGYGVVHTAAAIDRALAAADPYTALGYHPADADPGPGAHGTHVLGIAAGNGRSGAPAGVAPGSDLVFVHLATWGPRGIEHLGDSVTLLEAIDFILRLAARRPCVINLSMGRHGESHDGTTLVEQGLDAALRAAPGRAICQSAGNYYTRRIHASGQLRPAEERVLPWDIDEVVVRHEELELWYPGRDTLEVVVRPPGGPVTPRAGPGARVPIEANGQVVGRVYHRRAEPNNLANHVEVFLDPGAPAGPWEIVLIGADVLDGRYHAWLERDVGGPRRQSRFRAADANPSTTTGTICNGYRTIAVGAYDPHDPGRPVARFSSSGPTRDGRVKPDLIAPGVRILAARSAPRGERVGDGGPPRLTRMSGTSMAAPFVTGTVALMFEAAPRPLRIEETHNLLLSSARRAPPEAGGAARVGSGYCDIARAVDAAHVVDAPAALLAPEASDAGPAPTPGTDIPEPTGGVPHVAYVPEVDTMNGSVIDPEGVGRDVASGGGPNATAAGIAEAIALLAQHLARRGSGAPPAPWPAATSGARTEAADDVEVADDVEIEDEAEAVDDVEAEDEAEAVVVLPVESGADGGLISSTRLHWADAPPEQLTFMRAVYDRHVARSSKGRSFVGDVPEDQLGPIEKGHRARTAAAEAARALLAAARAEIERMRQAGERPELGKIEVGVTSAYRPASVQFGTWQRNFPKYHDETRAQRAVLPGGEHGPKAVNWLAGYIGRRVGAPGFSLHNNGLAIDLTTTEGGRHLVAGTGASNIRAWRRSWFFEWLTANAGRFGYGHNPAINEPWHIQYNGTPSTPRESLAESDGAATWREPDVPTLTVLSSRALIRSGPPDFRSTGRAIPNGTQVRVRETRDTYAAAAGINGTDYGWTSRENLGGFYKDSPRLQGVALAPAAPVEVPSGPELRRSLAETYNRIGGLLGVLAAETGIPLSAVLGVWYIESRGRRLVPGHALLRFENHKLFNLWGHDHPEVYDAHFRHGGRGDTPGRKTQNHMFRERTDAPFEACHRDQKVEYRVLALARRLAGDDFALQSVSIGGPQILMSGYRTLGYPTPRAMYDAFQADERAHVLGFFDFCLYRYGHGKRRGEMFGHLAAGRWVPFARGYNGVGKEVLYGDKLRAASDEARALLGSIGAAARAESVAESVIIPAGRAEVDTVPLLSRHHGAGPDLVLRWNAMTDPTSVVHVVVYLHGYSGKGARMTVPRDKELDSGTDFANPDNPADPTPGRRPPTVAAIPRGFFAGGTSGKAYTFPALTAPGGINQLIDDALTAFAQRFGLPKLTVGRTILSAHSGGGVALLKILEYFEPNEVQVYDATYQPTDALVKWVRKSIARDQAALAAGVGDDPAKFLRERGGSLRLFYRPLSKTEPYSLSALRAISAALRKDPNTTALLAPRYRVERTSVPHSGMPRHFGWRLLADAGADVPRASRAQ